MREGFREEHDAAWRRLTKTESFLLHLYDDPDSTEPDAKWYVYLSLDELLSLTMTNIGNARSSTTLP